MIFSAAAPEEKGLNTGFIEDFIKDMQMKQVPMHSYLLYIEDSIVSEGYYAPCKKNTLHRMFSITKSLTALAIGILESEGSLNLSDPIIRYFPDMVPENVHPWIAEMTIENMLMMRTCHASTTYKLAANGWVKTFFTTPPTHKPGTIFHYDTSSAHVLAALVERLSGMPLWDFLKEKLKPLEFSPEAYVLTDPDGVSIGGSGLVATTRDLLNIGLLLMNNGIIDGKQLVPAEFLQKAVAPLTSNAFTGGIPSEASGYGYMIWHSEKDGYVCYGMGGQFIMVFPEKKCIFITTADTQGMAGGNQLIYDSFYHRIYDHIKSADTETTSEATKNLCQTAYAPQNLALTMLSSYSTASVWKKTTPFLSQINHTIYRVVDSNNLGNADCKNNVSGFSEFSFNFDHPQQSVLNYTYNGEHYQLTFGLDSIMTGQFPIYNQFYAGNGIWLDDRTLYIRFHIIDAYVGSVRMQFYFGENDLTVYMKKVEESLFQEFNTHLYAVAEN